MSKLNELETKYKELGEEIEKLKNEKLFDFRDLLLSDFSDPFIERIFTDFTSILDNEYGLQIDKHLGHMQAGIVIEQHFKRIIGDWVPDWSDEDQGKCDIFYDYLNDKIIVNNIVSGQWQPSFIHVPYDKKDEILEEITRMKNIYGFDIVKYYLTGEA